MDGSSLEVLVFEVAGHRYGLFAAAVRELLRAAALTPLPRAPAGVEGMLNLRGRFVPVYDVRTRFGLPARPMVPTDHLVVAQSGGVWAALRVDRATDLIRVNAADVEDARGLVPGAESVGWVVRLADEIVLVHDLRTFLSPAETAALAAVLPAETGGPP